MAKLCVAISESNRQKLEEEFDERSAGAWRSQVLIQSLDAAKVDKTSNDGYIEDLSRDPEIETIYAAVDLTSRRLSAFPKVSRMSWGELIAKTSAWFCDRGLDWRANIAKIRKHGPYRWCDLKTWVDQFARIDSQRGPRVAKALLLQLQLVSLSDLSSHFQSAGDEDHHAYFIGSDPHSGDFGLVNILSAILPGKNLTDAQRLPKLISNRKINLYSDAGWSGGESVRRLECMYRACGKKDHFVQAESPLSMRFGFLTDIAEQRLRRKCAELRANQSAITEVILHCPPTNKLIVNKPGLPGVGLAFQRDDLCNYVDPLDRQEFMNICTQIGRQLAVDRPLGTNSIASTIGFGHSLPKAMLPLFIVDGKTATASDGTTFVWKALILSEHISRPASNQDEVYCIDCPLAR